MVSLIGTVAQSLIGIYYRKTEHREDVLGFFCNIYLHLQEVRTDFFVQASLVFLSKKI